MNKHHLFHMIGWCLKVFAVACLCSINLATLTQCKFWCTLFSWFFYGRSICIYIWHYWIYVIWTI